MLIRKTALRGEDIASSEYTPMEAFTKGRPATPEFLGRRSFMKRTAAVAGSAAAASLLPATAWADNKIPTVPSKYTVPDTQTPFAKATTYNNFYEFGLDKSEPAQNAHTLVTSPWSVEVTGLVKKLLKVSLDDLARYRPLESRVYRHRCVEAWSMVIPWDGYSLSEFINFCQPLPSAKYIQFVSYLNRKQMPDLPGGFDWPFTEGLRMDEAMHPMTLLTFGCYGQTLPNQNGAPVRVVVPWKYGYKSPKSIVKMIFTSTQPTTLWNEQNPGAYGFYSNVNPAVDTVPWSQEHERRLDGSVFGKTVQTQMFNGYGDQVAGLYNGMDLRKDY